MEGCLCEVLRQFHKLSDSEIKSVLSRESKDLEITKSLLNLIHNIVIIGSVSITKTQREFLDSNTILVLDLLSTRLSLKFKKALFLKHPSLTRYIAKLCPVSVSG